MLKSIDNTKDLLGLGRTSIYSLIKEGRLETVKIGARRLVKMDSIKAFIERGTGGAV